MLPLPPWQLSGGRRTGGHFPQAPAGLANLALEREAGEVWDEICPGRTPQGSESLHCHPLLLGLGVNPQPLRAGGSKGP